MTERTYTLTITETQADILRDACELLARLRMGQCGDIQRLALPDLPTDLLPEFREHTDALERITRGLTQTARDETGVRENAWDLYQVLRYRLACDRTPPEKRVDPLATCYREPCWTGTALLARMEAAE